jgi:hypothetical protein
VFENRVLGTIFGPKRNVVTGGQGVEKTSYRGDLRSVLTKYHSGDQIKNYMGGACSTYGGQKCVRGFVGETWGKETTSQT